MAQLDRLKTRVLWRQIAQGDFGQLNAVPQVQADEAGCVDLRVAGFP